MASLAPIFAASTLLLSSLAAAQYTPENAPDKTQEGQSGSAWRKKPRPETPRNDMSALFSKQVRPRHELPGLDVPERLHQQRHRLLPLGPT